MITGTDKVFKFGTALVVVFSLVIGILHVGVLYLFGIPIIGLLAGLILVWIGKAGISAKSMVTLCSIPIALIAFLLSFYWSLAESEAFLIPHNYRGEIVVFLGEECGQNPVTENGRRIYNIPSSGVLITKLSKNDGYMNQKFYLVDETGNRTEIPIFNRQDFETEEREWSKYGRSDLGELTKETVGAFWAYGSETYFHSKVSIAYRIYSYRQLEGLVGKEGWFATKSFGKASGELLKNCRSGLSSSR